MIFPSAKSRGDTMGRVPWQHEGVTSHGRDACPVPGCVPATQKRYLVYPKDKANVHGINE